ncbi:hypothetical protein SAMN05421825_1557 [Epilithonimonas hungarica]|uniref:Uncharacterized protein n=1 Tax=Epilithonimonas hungarica TaxID=454006 RepID=A0A1G7LNV5_9FLAO|nr:hypothetical protein SAMN05421825_1557 [Epilithonimonas hungarica]
MYQTNIKFQVFKFNLSYLYLIKTGVSDKAYISHIKVYHHIFINLFYVAICFLK